MVKFIVCWNFTGAESSHSNRNQSAWEFWDRWKFSVYRCFFFVSCEFSALTKLSCMTFVWAVLYYCSLMWPHQSSAWKLFRIPIKYILGPFFLTSVLNFFPTNFSGHTGQQKVLGLKVTSMWALLLALLRYWQQTADLMPPKFSLMWPHLKIFVKVDRYPNSCCSRPLSSHLLALF